MWQDIRKLFDTISQVQSFENEETNSEVIEIIEKYKNRLASVLCNNPKSAQDKEKLVPNAKLTIDDVELTLDERLCNEAMIISEIFTINEIDAVQLVVAGEAQKIHFDGMNRGLIAVICYYDAHRLLITSLRHILNWDREEVPPRLLQIIDSYFIKERVIKHLMALIGTFTVQSEFARLLQPNVNGLGGSKHQKLLRNAVEEIRSEIMGCISAICKSPGTEIISIINHLFHIIKNVPTESLNMTNLAAWLSLVKLTSSEVLTQVQDASSVLDSMIAHIRNETAWSDQAMCGTMQLACAVSLRSLASSPADHLGIENVKFDVDLLIDRSIRNMAFQYMRLAIIGSSHFKYSHQFVVVDDLLKQLVAHFPAKLMETERNSSDELTWLDEHLNLKEKSTNVAFASGSSGSTQNTAVPEKQYEQSPSNYENFLRCFVDLYELIPFSDTEITTKTRRETELCDQIEESSLAFSTEGSIELCRLLERARHSHHVIHAVAYLEMAAAVCRNKYTAAFLYDVFAKDQSEMFGWETLMTALRAYDRLFREQKSMMNRTMNQSQQQQQNQKLNEKSLIPTQELSGLIAWLRIATKVAYLDDSAAKRFSDDQSWGALASVASIASSSVPLSLKASLFDFLNSVGRLKGSATRVWQVINAYQLCYFAENGVLMGIQQELEERECPSKQYDVSLSFVALISTLMEHKSLPDFAAPFIQFVTKSILSQFSSRSYNNVSQMWHLAEKALKAANNLLEHGIVEPRAVSSNDIHIALLTQCLNDTPLFRALGRILMEDCQAQTDPYTSTQTLSSDAALIALRILSRAIVLHPALRACARVSSSDLIVASIQSLVFTPIHTSSPCTLLDLIFQYLHLSDDYPLHSLYAARIFRDVIATKGAAQGTMLELLKSRDSAGTHVKAVRTALCTSSIHYTIDDSLEKDEDTTNAMFARGETARILLETLSDAIDNHVNRSSSKFADANNICYYLLAFRPSKANSKELYENDDILTGLHYVLHIIEQFISTKTPFSLPFSALLEPCFRLMQRLVSVSCPFSQPVLCFMRSSNIIEKLVTSPFVCSALAVEDEIDNTYANGVFSIRRMIAGYILHFAAVEISAMLTTGHFTRPETLYRALLEYSEMVTEYTMNENNDEDGNENANLLFSLLRRATVSRKFDLVYPELVHFDVNKLHELFDACLTVTIYGVPQYDVAYLNRLLRREIDAVYTECEEIKYVQKEMENVLEYCAEVNANLLSESANERIVSGCTALLNVFSVFAPVHFFTNSTQLIIFRDSCYVLIEMMSGIGGASLIAACQTFHRMVETVARLAKTEYKKISELRQFFAPLFKSMIELMLQPRDKGIDAKISLYRTIRLVLRDIFEKDCTDNVHEAEEWLLDGHATTSGSSDEIVNVVDSLSDDIARHLASNIADLPKHRKAAVIMLANDLLHEDLKGSKKLCGYLSRSGVPRIMCEELLSISFDWNIIVSTDGTALSTKNEQLSQFHLLTSILTTFTRFGASESGWNLLSELAITEVLSDMIVFAEPPKDVFLKPESVKTKGTAANVYSNTLDLALHVCKQLCTKSKWKKLSLKVLAFVQSLGDVFQQLMRADVNCNCLETARSIVFEISVNDESIIDAIEGDSVLRQLKNPADDVNSRKNGSKHPQVLANSSFATPRQLFSTLLPV